MRFVNMARSECRGCRPPGAYKVYARNANRRGHLFEISLDEYQSIVCQPCRYCGAHDEVNGIDQVVAGAGYTLVNCVPCCTICNRMKSDNSVAVFVQHALRIAGFQQTQSILIQVEGTE